MEFFQTFLCVEKKKSVAQVVRWECGVGCKGWEQATFLCFCEVCIDGKDVNE